MSSAAQALDLSVLRLNQLGFFEKIEEKDYTVTPDPKNAQVDVTVKVKERSQQSIGLTGGVSGISGSFIGLNYTTNNFLGRGETLEFAVTGGTRTTDFMISFTEPYLMDSRWNLGLSVFNQRYRFDTYTLYGFTGALTGGDPVELFTRRTTGTTDLAQPAAGILVLETGRELLLPEDRNRSNRSGIRALRPGAADRICAGRRRQCSPLGHYPQRGHSGPLLQHDQPLLQPHAGHGLDYIDCHSRRHPGR